MRFEVMGGTGLAKTLTLEAIAKGKHVVSANKAIIGGYLQIYRFSDVFYISTMLKIRSHAKLYVLSFQPHLQKEIQIDDDEFISFWVAIVDD